MQIYKQSNSLSLLFSAKIINMMLDFFKLFIYFTVKVVNILIAITI